MSKKNMNYKAAQRHDFSERMSREYFVEGKKAGKYKGVKRNYLGRFTAQIRDSIAKKWRWLGTFDTPEEVAAAYANAAAEMKERRSQMNSESCSLSASSHPDIHIIKREQCFNRAELDSKTKRIDCKTYLLSLKNTASSFTWTPTFKSMTTLINSLISCAFAAEQETVKPISSGKQPVVSSPPSEALIQRSFCTQEFVPSFSGEGRVAHSTRRTVGSIRELRVVLGLPAERSKCRGKLAPVRCGGRRACKRGQQPWFSRYHTQ